MCVGGTRVALVNRQRGREDEEASSSALLVMVKVSSTQYPAARWNSPRLRSDFQHLEALEGHFAVARGRRMSWLRMIEEGLNVAVDHSIITGVARSVNCRMVCPQGLESGLAKSMGAPAFRY